MPRCTTLLLRISLLHLLLVAGCSSTSELQKPERAEVLRPAPSAASPSRRIALVIGNSAYPSEPISSPRHDVDAIARKLEGLDFSVTAKTDLGRHEFFDALRAFGLRLAQPATAGLFYYSGHGMQVHNRNYMIPTDADIHSEADMAQYAVAVEDVLARMELANSNPNVVILDACRTNPFEKRLKGSQAGLARMDAPAGTLIAFAAAPGKAAEAGIGRKLSVYTEALVEHIDTPHQSFIDMFMAVHNAVVAKSDGRQRPHLDLSPGLPSSFSFVPAADAAVPPPAPPSSPDDDRAVRDAASVRPRRLSASATSAPINSSRPINQNTARVILQGSNKMLIRVVCDSSIMRSVRDGQEVTVVGRRDDEFIIRDDSGIGCIPASYLSIPFQE